MVPLRINCCYVWFGAFVNWIISGYIKVPSKCSYSLPLGFMFLEETARLISRICNEVNKFGISSLQVVSPIKYWVVTWRCPPNARSGKNSKIGCFLHRTPWNLRQWVLRFVTVSCVLLLKLFLQACTFSDIDRDVALPRKVHLSISHDVDVEGDGKWKKIMVHFSSEDMDSNEEPRYLGM